MLDTLSSTTASVGVSSMSANLLVNSLPGVVTVAVTMVAVKVEPGARKDSEAMSTETVREEIPEGTTLVTNEGT